MNKKYQYDSENKKNFLIYFLVYDKINIRLFISDLSSEKRIFVSNYQLDDLNIKFKKLIQLKTIEKFRDLLIENIKKKTLILKEPYKNSLTSIWRIFPDSKDKKQTFSLASSLDSRKKITLLFYSDFKTSEPLVKEIEKSIKTEKPELIDKKFFKLLSYKDNWLIESMYFLTNQNDDDSKKKEDFLKLYEKPIENLYKDEEPRSLFVFFDGPNILDSMKTIIERTYFKQPFILIFSEKEKKIFKYEIKEKIYEIMDEDDEDGNDLLPYFDMNNIFIYKKNEESFKKAIMPILKVYRYFNQLGDSFFKKLPELINIDSNDKEIRNLFHTHYFNILLCGRSGTGKSTFINTMMGEKKAYTSKMKSVGTFRNNYYIHKKYPIKIIDVCGFAEGSEGYEIKKKIKYYF